MAWAHCVFGALASMAARLLGDLLCFCSMAASRPLLLTYLLFFSPYLLATLAFLRPLLVSTCFLILALLTVSPYLRGSSPPPPSPPPDGGRGPFGNTLRLVVGMLDPSAGGEITELLPPPEALCGIASALQACVSSVEEMYRERGEDAAVGAEGGSPGDDGGGEEEEAEEEEKRIVAAEAAPSSAELFGWELEAISKLYKALTYEVEEFPVRLALRSFKEDDLFPPEIGLIQGGEDGKLKSGESGEPGEDLKETPCSAEFQGRKVPSREEVGIPVWNPSKSAIKSRDRGELPDRNPTGEISSPPKRPTPRSKGSISRSESDGSSKLLRLRRSSSSSSTSAAAAAAGLSRVASARGWSAAGTKGAQPQAMSSSGSMRKEKEWRRTLACKLFEERMVADGGEEGMDLLWETYEQGSGKVEGDGGSSSSSKKVSHSRHDKDRSRKQESSKAKRSGELKVEADDDDDDEEEEDEEEEATTGRLCCLRALRFSTSKMGLGVGRSGLLRKVSKAMKGVGVFRPHSGRKTG